ncbi:MAG: iron-containing alcohol dehydrogenase, partial [Ilumatobacteraceae bacterium]
MAEYERGSVPRVLVGTAGPQAVAEFAAGRGATTAVLIVDGSAVTNGYIDRIDAALTDAACVERIERYVVPPSEPDARSVDAAAELVRSVPRPIVVGVGGGSALDTAKQAAVVAAAAAGVEHYALGAHPLPGRRALRATI